VQAPEGPVSVSCSRENGAFSDGVVQLDLRASATTVVRVVRYRRDAVELGVELEAEPEGARVTRVRRRALRAGLRAGDLVRAVDGVPLAGLGGAAMTALAFEAPPEAAIQWTIERNAQTLTITAPAW